MEIKTNHKPRELVSWFDLPTKMRAEFDYPDEVERCTPRFVFYKRWWYDVYDATCVRSEGNNSLKGWDGYVGDTFFSGVLFRFNGEDDTVICGTYYC